MGEENFKNRGELVLETLKREILNLRLKPEQMTGENGVCDRSGVSRIPVRDTLRLSQEQGFMGVVPYRKTYVTPLSLDNTKQMIYMRVAMETMVLRDFTQVHIPIVMEDIRHAITQQKALIQEPGFGPEQFYHMSAQMYSIRFWAVKCQKLWRMLQAQQLHYTRLRILDFITETDFERIVGERGELFQLISQGDEKGLEESFEKHLYYNMKRICHSIEMDYEDYFEEEPEEGWFVI